ncbi:putative protein kinase RLK-Pelle-RLCK-VIIa-2 family [Medicago truncatula]|uniref:non-specific serine/threonine protein kinase n=1 Tax=Medicago truncatula TaxID=3880 RepID=A0A396IQE4_MEDTR|nr:putative protein kinase RLK-Pelle-RLCK-VIIa-2 family [Medicago truncatula]
MNASIIKHDKVVVGAQYSSTSSNTRSQTPNGVNYYSNLNQFTYRELKLATGHFAPECFLGEGGFGSVYKGWIGRNERISSRPRMGVPVAVKTLNKEGNQEHKEWLAEINHLGALQHPNLVRLVGYCIEDENRLLVYEFMPKGSLENHLFKRRSTPLTWAKRMKIMLGAAKGLAFLHEEAEKPIIYRDFKTSNILLDSDYNAKLSDFGLAKNGPMGDKTHVSAQVIGTQGYVDPEYVMTGHLSSKSDVYSFGVVLLEMLTGRKSIDRKRPENEQTLIEWVKPFLKKPGGRFCEVMDPRMQEQYSKRGAYKAMKIVAHCIYRDKKARPLMSEVVKELKTIIDYNNDIPSSPMPSPLLFKVLHDGASSSNSSRHVGGGSGANKCGPKIGSSSSASTPSTPARFKDSPLNFTPPLLSPNPPCGGNPLDVVDGALIASYWSI